MTFRKFFAAVVQAFNPFTEAVKRAAPEIEAKIEAILKDAKAKADALRAEHDSGAIEAKRDLDLAAAKVAYESHVALIKADAAARLAATKLILPVLKLPVSAATGPTGATGNGPNT